MAKGSSFEGVFPILVTPFDEREEIDLESFDRVVRFMADIGVDGVTILGVLGESNRLRGNQRERTIRAAVSRALVARGKGQRDGIEPHPLVDVDEVHADGLEPDERLPLSRLRGRDLLQGHCLGASVPENSHRFHHRLHGNGPLGIVGVPRTPPHILPGKSRVQPSRDALY